ncbi:hypothetical protein K502DRAFT_344475 [Neoconidiobolus thromboides FSU 785]|nr:hypothetical protein K502DRAFT_344475 [Neoconidiobolus thromboides FSU 785]
MKNIIQNMDSSLARMWDKIKSIPNKTEELSNTNFHHGRARMNSLPTSKIEKNNSRVYSKDDNSLSHHKYSNKRQYSLNRTLKNNCSTSQLRFFHDDHSLKHARRRIKLANDFDSMLTNGFPTLNLKSLNTPEKELTIFISLTPEVAKMRT